MNLGEMVDFVCGKTRRASSTAQEKCRGFIANRYAMIYNSALWKDSLYRLEFNVPVTGSATFPNTNALAAAGYFFFPSIVDRVLAIRRDDGIVNVVDPFEVFKTTMDEFEESGTVVNFDLLPAAVAQDLTGTTFSLGADAEEAGMTFIVRGITAAHQRVKLRTLIDAFPKALSQQLILVETFTKPETVNDCALYGGPDGGYPYVTVPAAETRAKPCQRVRFGQAPTATTYFKALIKREILPLEEDEDTPELLNLEPVLLAFGQGDLLQYERQYGKAQALFQEATALLTDYKQGAIVQTAHRERILPDVCEVSGSVNDWMPTKGYI